jgi:hypothetical protein
LQSPKTGSGFGELEFDVAAGIAGGFGLDDLANNFLL